MLKEHQNMHEHKQERGSRLMRRIARPLALAALAALVPAAGALTPALLSVATSSVLVAVAAAETFWRREATA